MKWWCWGMFCFDSLIGAVVSLIGAIVSLIGPEIPLIDGL